MIDLFIIGVIAVIIFALLKLKHVQHRFLIILIVVLALFFFLSANKAIKNNNINLKSLDGILAVFKIYLNWFSQLGHNFTELGGYAIKMNWQGNASEVVGHKPVQNSVKANSSIGIWS